MCLYCYYYSFASYDVGLLWIAAILNLSNMADTQELQRLALVPNLMDRSLSIHDTDDCVADLRHLKRYHVVYFDENNFYIYFCALSLLLTTPPDKTTPRNRLSFLRRTPEVAPGHNTGHSYVHAHISQNKCKSTLRPCHWPLCLAIFNHACNGIYPLQLMHVKMWISHKCKICKGR